MSRGYGRAARTAEAGGAPTHAREREEKKVGACSHPETTQERGKKSRGGNREGGEREGLPIYLRRRASRLLGSNGSLRLAGRRGALICDLGGRRAGGCGGLLPPRLVRGARCGVVRGARFRFPLFALPVYSYFLQLPDPCPGTGRDLYIQTSHSTLLYFIFYFIFLFNSN